MNRICIVFGRCGERDGTKVLWIGQKIIKAIIYCKGICYAIPKGRLSAKEN